jgi:hypothetical protein
MPLFQVQDSDRPLWVVARDWHHAVQQWKDQIAIENNGDGRKKASKPEDAAQTKLTAVGK